MNGIYFMRAGNDGPIKIGYSNDAKKRLKVLGTGSHSRLHLLSVVPGGVSLERDFHERFSKDRMHGEWFSPSQDLVKFISTLPQIPPSPEPRRGRKVIIGINHGDPSKESNALAQWIDGRGLKRLDVAKALKISPGYLTDVCAGTCWPSREVLQRIADYTAGSVTPDSLMPLKRRKAWDQKDAAQ